MSEYISKEELIDRLRKTELSADQIRMLVYPKEAVARAIYDCTSADVRENIHAYWKLVNPLQSDDGGAYCCSNCGSGTWGIVPRYWKGCPWCLAIMDGEPKGEKGD